MSGTVKVLSIDGGGIRGIIPALVLMEIEELTKKPIATLFDLIAGTSTGGILALGLTLQDPDEPERPKYRAKDIIKLYENQGERIFSSSIWRKIKTLGAAADEKYAAEDIEGVLDEYFRNAKLKDSLTDVLITAYEMERRFPFFFRSSRAKSNPEYDFPVVKVARATSAAPTYFEPLKLETEDGSDYYTLVDGGVFANNPAMCAYVEAKHLYPDADEFLIVSLGTGQMTRPLFYKDVKDWGLINWARPILDVVFDGVSDTVDYQVMQLLSQASGKAKCYYRFQVNLPKENDDMDNASEENVLVLRRIAQDMIHERHGDIQELSKVLME